MYQKDNDPETLGNQSWWRIMWYLIYIDVLYLYRKVTRRD